MAAVEIARPTSARRESFFGRHLLRNSTCTAVLLAMALFVLYPLALLVYGSFILDDATGGPKQFGIDAWVIAWQQPGMVQAIVNTLKRVVLTEVISLPIAVLIAWLVSRTDMPGKKIIDSFFWVAFFLPSLPVCSA